MERVPSLGLGASRSPLHGGSWPLSRRTRWVRHGWTSRIEKHFTSIVHDFHTAALMREHGVSEIRTADTDFHQFPFLEW